MSPALCAVCRRPGVYSLPEVQIDGPAWVCSGGCERELSKRRLPASGSAGREPTRPQKPHPEPRQPPGDK
jgi:hypothetical protein